MSSAIDLRGGNWHGLATDCGGGVVTRNPPFEEVEGALRGDASLGLRATRAEKGVRERERFLLLEVSVGALRDDTLWRKRERRAEDVVRERDRCVFLSVSLSLAELLRRTRTLRTTFGRPRSAAQAA